MEQEKSILNHLETVVHWRRMIVLSVLVVSLGTAGVSFVLPEAYRARAAVYPPQESQDMLGLTALMGNLPMGLLGMGGGGVSATEFVPVVQSERVAEAVIREFGLDKRYDAPNREVLLKMVGDRLEVELSREQFLAISYEEKTPQLAADITNAFVKHLDEALAKRQRAGMRDLLQYLENRLAEARDDMHQAGSAYKEFQQEHMAIDLETQAKVQIENASELFSLLAQLIVTREVAERKMASGHPELKRLDLEIAGYEDALNRVLMGQEHTKNGGEKTERRLPEIFIPFRDMPPLGLEVLQLGMDLEVQTSIYQFVRQEYEKARFEDEKEASQVVVLDRAVAPDIRSRPRRTLMVITAVGLSLMLSTLLAFVFEALRGLGPEDRDRLDRILRDLKLRRRME